MFPILFLLIVCVVIWGSQGMAFEGSPGGFEGNPLTAVIVLGLRLENQLFLKASGGFEVCLHQSASY